LVLQDGIVDITLQGSGDLSVIGNDEDNFVTGNDGANRLEGGAGADSLIGGDGADVFVYSDILDGGDLIVGFDGDAGDRIDLGLLFDALGLSEADLDARVNIDQTGTDATIALDADGDGSFEVTLVTVADVTGDLTGGHLALLAA
jgi:Ca2+-binding RTX toxin-like protein